MKNIHLSKHENKVEIYENVLKNYKKNNKTKVTEKF